MRDWAVPLMKERLHRMGFYHNEVEQLLAFAVTTGIDPFLIGEFIMHERFKAWMKKLPSIQKMIEMGSPKDESG